MWILRRAAQGTDGGAYIVGGFGCVHEVNSLFDCSDAVVHFARCLGTVYRFRKPKVPDHDRPIARMKRQIAESLLQPVNLA